LGQHAEAVALLHAAAQQAAVEGNAIARAELLLDEAMVLDWLGEYQKAQERVLAAKALNLEGSSPLIDARLMLGLGRSSVRSNRGEQAADELTRAARLAACLGDEGYETRVISLFMLGFVLPGLGRVDEAATALDEANQLCEERGDLLHLGGVLSNRALVRGYRGDRVGANADFEAVIALGRKLGQLRIELIGHYNLAEYLYQVDELDAVEAHIAAAAELAQKPNAATFPEVVYTLEARVKFYRGHADEALEIVQKIRRAQKKARQQQNGLELLSTSEDVFAAVIELATSEATDAQWNELEARSAMYSFGQEQIEVLEVRALYNMRGGRYIEAVRRYERALELSERILTVMVPRLHRGLAVAREAAVTTP
jgi:tetratricopeptide (TPR) repeat protein